MRDNDGNGVYGDGQDGVDPNRNYPTAWGLDEEGASFTRRSPTYRGPFPLSEPEDLAYDRLLRKITPEAVINYHSAAQLLLYPFGYITDVYADDDPWFKAITGTDGDAAVDPYISQRSSDLYITNGETTDHAYNKYATMAWTPELDECETAAGGTFCSGGSGFTFPDDEGKVEGVFQKNLDFARNVAATTLDRDRPDRPRNATDDETQYQVKAAPDIEPNRFNVSSGASQTLEATARRILGPVDFVVQVESGPGGNGRTLTLRAEDWRGGERFGDLRGKYYRRVRTQMPADFVQPGHRAVAAAAGRRRRGQRPRDRGLPAAALLLPRGLHAAGGRCQAGAGGGGRGLHGPVAEQDPIRDRAALSRRARRGARGQRLHGQTYDVDIRPRARRLAGSEQLSDLGVLSHFDAVVYYTGDDLVPQALGQGVTDTNYRRGGTVAANQTYNLTGSQHLTTSGVRNAQMLRNYMNEGGKVVFAGRNGWVQQTSTGTGLNYSDYTWWQEPVYGFNYPPNQAGDDDRPHTAFFRELDISNDWASGGSGSEHARAEWARDRVPRRRRLTPSSGRPDARAGAGGLLDGMGQVTLDTGVGAGGRIEPTQDPVTGLPDPRAKTPTRLRSISSVTLQRPFRQERIEADYAGAPAGNGGAIISTRDSVVGGVRAGAGDRRRGPQRAGAADDGPPAAAGRTPRRRRSGGCGPVRARR